MSAPVNAKGIIPVTAAGFATPELLRTRLELDEGLSVLDIFKAAMPMIHERDYHHFRVTLVSSTGMALIAPENWHRVYPHNGTHVVIRLIPGKEALRIVLQILVTVAATALGAPWAGTLFGSFLTAGATLLGKFLINLLIPQDNKKNNKEQASYSISGWQNRANPDGPVAYILGRMRYAPEPIVRWTEIVDDKQIVRAWFSFGYGRVKASDFKIGDTPFEKFEEIEWEYREGLSTDAPFTIITQQIYEEALSRVLSRPLPRDDFGEITAGAAEVKPVSVFTGSGGFRHGFIFSMPQGMVAVNKKGKTYGYQVIISVRRRLNGVGAWETLSDITITARKTEGFFRQMFLDVAVEGRYEYEFTRATDESASDSIRDQVVLAGIQTFRRESPVNFDFPLAGLQVRIKATFQLNGTLDTVNALCERWTEDWDTTSNTWVERFTENPAALYRHALKGVERSKPISDAQIDLPTIQHWHEMCTAKGLTYNRVHNFESNDFEVLRQIAAAGLAAPTSNGVLESVIIDEPQSLVVAHLNPLNSRDFRWKLPYLELPDAIRVRFQDETNDWQSAERLIPWIGHTGDIGLTEEWTFAGKTNPDEIWLLTMRRMLEVDKRRETFTCIQDGMIRTAVRGDLVMGIVERLDDRQRAARVSSVRGNFIALNDEVTMEAGTQYGLRFRVFSGPSDALGTSVLRPVTFAEGSTFSVVLTGTGDVPARDDIVHFGPLASDSLPLRIKKIERGEKGSNILTLTKAAPEIDTMLAAMTPPAWSPKVGTEITSGGIAPAAPVFVALVSGISNGGSLANSINLILAPGFGSSAIVGSYAVYHRLSGAGSWSGPVTVTAAGAGTEINAYAVGNSVEFQAKAVALDGTAGPLTTTRTIVVGAADAGAAAAFVSISMVAGLGVITATFTTGANQSSVKFYIQNAIGGSINRAVDFVREVAVEPNNSYTVTFGDATRVNLLTNGNFNAAGSNTYETGWSFATDKAAKAAGVANWVFEALSPGIGTVYRTRMKVTRTAGAVQMGLKGTTDVLGTARNASGTYYEALTGISGLTGGGAKADATFAGSVDDLIIYAQTTACLSQGGKTLWAEPFNADGVAGPLSTSLTDTVI